MEGFLMAYLGWVDGLSRALSLADVEVSDNEEDMEVVLTLRPLIRGLSSANGATNILGSVPANWETLCC